MAPVCGHVLKPKFPLGKLNFLQFYEESQKVFWHEAALKWKLQSYKLSFKQNRSEKGGAFWSFHIVLQKFKRGKGEVHKGGS